jgi:hypothetical protein
MPTAPDYAAMPDAGSMVYTTKELDAELALAPIAAKLVASLNPAAPVIQLASLAVLVWTGHWARGYLVPHGWDVPTACLGLLLLIFLIPAALYAPAAEDPKWARAAAVHQQALHGRVPEPLYQQVKAVTDRMTAGTRWRSAWLYVARCTSDQPVHCGACCAGGTYPRAGRLLVIIGEHLMFGPPEVAVAVLAHERRHVQPLNTYLFSLASIVGTLGLAVAGWAVPWPAALPVAVAVRYGAVAVLWAVEISCDLGSAREMGIWAMTEAVNYKQRTKEGARALRPAVLRWPLTLLGWLAGSEHPPYAVRRLAIRALTR